MDRKVTTGRVPLTVWLIQEENGHWYVHISFFRDKTQPDYSPVGAIGVDLNCDSIAETRVQVADGEPLVLHHEKRMFNPAWSKEQKEAWIHEQIREIVLEAKAQRCMVVLEYLDFEHCKRWLRTKLGAMLRVMPYRRIRKAFERKCMEHGVVLRYVKSNYTSILGAVLTSYPNLGRDQAAAAVIGLRALDEGNAWLEQQCQSVGCARAGPVADQPEEQIWLHGNYRWGLDRPPVEGESQRGRAFIGQVGGLSLVSKPRWPRDK